MHTYLKNAIKIASICYIPEETDGILVVSDNQEVIDYCCEREIAVVGLEHDDIKLANCSVVFSNVDSLDDIEDIYLERAYRRCKGIPWDIASTSRTYIREFCLDDLDAMIELYAKSGITEFMEPLYARDEEEEYQKKYIAYIYGVYEHGMWLVFDKATGELIGRAGIEVRPSCERDQEVEIGYCIAPERWNQGYGYEVCQKIIELAHYDYGYNSLIARVEDNNLPSRALLDKLGFKYEKRLEDTLLQYRLVVEMK